MYTNRNKNSRSFSKKKIILGTLLALCVLGGGTAAYLYKQGSVQTASQTSNSKLPSVNPIDYGPPTKEEQQAGDDQKSNPAVKDSDTQQTTQPTKAEIVVVDASQYESPVNVIEVRSYISNLVQSDGDCTFSFSQGSTTFMRSVKAEPDASTTICPATDIERSAFSAAGQWNVTIHYKSSQSEGSKSTMVTVK